jgi:hypothetical protein
MSDIVEWWKAVWADYKIVAGAIAGFIVALLMFVIRDAIWQRRTDRIKRQTDFREKQLDKFYSPLYLYYREAYARFDAWKTQNPESVLSRQPFFDEASTDVEETVFKDASAYASQSLLKLWSEFKAAYEKQERTTRREIMVKSLVKEYQTLRKNLGFDYDENELKTGEFIPPS